MAALLGKKPLIDKKLYDLAVKFLNNKDSQNIPNFVKKLEAKETHMAERLASLCRIVTEAHEKRMLKEHNVEISQEHKSSLTLDFYVLAWFSYLVLDLARDIDFEETMLDALKGNNDKD